MKTITIYGRNRNKFQNLFPKSIFEGYECRTTFAIFTISEDYITLVTKCTEHNIKVIDIK